MRKREKRSEEKMKQQKLFRRFAGSTVKIGRTNISPPISDMECLLSHVTGTVVDLEKAKATRQRRRAIDA